MARRCSSDRSWGVAASKASSRQLLYLGGNGQVYVLVDPCNGNDVEYVSVVRHRLEVIDEITCEDGDGP